MSKETFLGKMMISFLFREDLVRKIIVYNCTGKGFDLHMIPMFWGTEHHKFGPCLDWHPCFMALILFFALVRSETYLVFVEVKFVTFSF